MFGPGAGTGHIMHGLIENNTPFYHYLFTKQVYQYSNEAIINTYVNSGLAGFVQER